ncbi:MAG TPA: ABC transporter permease [Bryobacteraceae bacterium]|nr:ABC transporter permease [Bryobacteraceae bacterium]
MNWFYRLTHRRKLEEQLQKELHFHLDQYAKDLIARGYASDAAYREARIAVGRPEQMKEECRDARGTRWIEDLWQDFRYALRSLRHRPGFTAVAVLTLALGIGASTAMFSAVNPILFEPLPYPHASRVMTLWDFGAEGAPLFTTFGTFRELSARNRSFEALATFRAWQPAMTGSDVPERLDGQRVSADYFRVLGVSPMLGHDFDSSDDRVNGPRVAILSYRLWQRRFNGDPTIVGRQITLDDTLFNVSGVMPQTFENVLSTSAELWTPLQYDTTLPLDGREWGHHLRMIGRLRAGVARDQAQREIDTIAHTPVREFTRAPWAALSNGFILRSLQDDVTRGVRPALLAVLGAVLLLLAIACVNVMNLLLAQGAQRRSEFAMRIALGAGRMRIIRQMLTESLLLAAIGGGLGILVANFGVAGIVALSPAGLPRAIAITVDRTVFGFAFLVTAFIGLGIGLIPALRAYREDLQVKRTIGGHQKMRRALVVTEVALALVLLVGAGLLLRSMQRVFAVLPGFNPSHLLTMQIQTASRRLEDDRANRQFFAQALEAVRQVPGVSAAALTSQLPLSGEQLGVYGIRFESNDPKRNDSALRYAVSPGYLETMNIPLKRGRLLDSHDAAGAPIAVLINESLAKRKFPNGDAVGRRIHAGSDEGPWGTIVGVVGDVRQTSLAAGIDDAFYMTSAQGWFADNPMSLVVRVNGDAATLAPAIKKAIWAVDKDQPITHVATMNALVDASEAQRHFALIVFETFAFVAVALAAAGIYGVLSGSVAERTREIGVRAALGASRSNILGLVMRQAMTLTAFGVVIGLAGAVAASRALITLLFGISRLDPVTYGAVMAMLGCVSMIAAWIPAWRASRVDPVRALRAE